MITQTQIEELAQFYQIDQVTIFREYLQLLFLNYLYQQSKADKVYFKGGTAIHLLFNSTRFSEDLDFSTEYQREQIKRIIDKVKQEINRELSDTRILLLHQGKKSLRFRLEYTPAYFKYPFVIRFDFTEKEKPKKKPINSPLVTKFPIAFFSIINHYSPEEILAEKVRAFLIRAKGRDIFDLWFLLEKEIPFDIALVKQKMKKVGKKFNKEKLIKKVKKFSLKKLKSDLDKFLPRPQRKITGVLKEQLIKKLLL